MLAFETTEEVFLVTGILSLLKKQSSFLTSEILDILSSARDFLKLEDSMHFAHLCLQTFKKEGVCEHQVPFLYQASLTASQAKPGQSSEHSSLSSRDTCLSVM